VENFGGIALFSNFPLGIFNRTYPLVICDKYNTLEGERGMLRSFYVALTGLNTSKDWLDITSNNIANANTIGFKRSRPVFQDIVLQNILHYNELSNSVTHITFGGGAITAATQTIFTPGPFKETGLNTDIAIDGDGFLILQDPNGKNYYTRDGELKFATEADPQTGQQYMYLVHQSGLKLMAYDISQLQDSTNVHGCPRLSPVRIPVELAPKATTEIYTQEGANIDPRSQIVNKTFDPTDATSYNASYSLQVYDSQGKAHDAAIFFVKLPAVEVSDSNGNSYYVFLDDDGNLYYQNGSNSYYVDKASSAATVNSSDEIITVRGNITAGSGNYDLVYDKTTGKYYLKDTSGNYYELATTTTEVTPNNGLRLDNLWQVYTLKNENGQWYDLNGESSLTDNSGFKFDIAAFNPDGTFKGLANSTNWTPSEIESNTDVDLVDPQGVLAVQKWNLKGLTSYPVDFSLGFSQDGYPPGRIQTVNIGEDGTITAVYSNGKSLNLYRLGLAYFNDKQVLQPTGGNLFEVSQTVTPLLECAGVRSQIRSGVLELSNVDVAQELINMINAEKAYQANAKVIQTGQTILDTTIQLKR